jgi:hypothetical protein
MPASGPQTAIGTGMSIGPLISLAGGYIESLFSNPLSGSSPANTTSTGAAASVGNQDTNQLSPFAQVLNSLQQLQQSNPSQYQQVTQQISSNLQTAAQSATASGNTSLANELNKLSTDFSSASTSGQLPNVQDLAQAIGGGHHHHPFHHGGSSPADSATSSGASAGTANTSSGLSQWIQSLNPSQTGTIANNSLNPLSIIDTTLSSAGIQTA